MPADFLKYITASLLTLLVLFIAPVQAASPQPQRLAIVVEAGSFMNQVWQGGSRGEALLSALNMQINTLPVQVEYKLWWVNDTITTYDKLNWPRPLGGFNPGFSGETSPTQALEDAVAWLGSGGGSLLFIGNTRPAPSFYRMLENDNIFCQVLALEPMEDLRDLALKGGGAYFVAPSPSKTLSYAGAAFKTAVSSGRLKLITHNPENEKIIVQAELTRSDTLQKSRQALSWRSLQIPPGGYRITWPEEGALPGPGAPPQKVTVGKSDGPELHAGGTGRISVESLDADGKEQNWPLAVLDADSGKLWESRRNAPFSLDLPVGVYRVYSIAPLHQEWRVGLTAGANAQHTFGPKGSLMVVVPAPGQKAQIPYQLESGTHQPSLRGQSGVKMALNPGSYTLTLHTVPKITREIFIAPGQNVEINIPPQGGVSAKRALGAPRSFDILDAQGALLARGGENRIIWLQPGQYILQWKNNPRRVPVIILPGQINVVEELNN